MLAEGLRRRLRCRLEGVRVARAPVSSRSAAAHLWALLSKGRIRERLERLVQRAQLVGEREEAFRVVKPAVQRLQLVPQRVQALEDRVELPVVEDLSFGHASIVRRGR